MNENRLKKLYLSLCKENCRNEEKRRFIQLFLKMMIEDELDGSEPSMDVDLIDYCIKLSLWLDRGKPSDLP